MKRAEWIEKLEEYKTSDEVMKKVCIDGIDYEWPVQPIVVIDYEEDTDNFSCYHTPRANLRECDRDGKGVCYTECITADDLPGLGFETEKDIEIYRKTWEEDAEDWEPDWTDLRRYEDFFEYYAVQETSEDAWDYGSYDWDEAVDMLRRQGHGLIAVIENAEADGFCVKEYTYDDIFDGEN